MNNDEMSDRDKSLDGHLLSIMSPAEKQERSSEAMRKRIAELEAERPIDVYNQGWNDALAAIANEFKAIEVTE
jgi:hypothetical protein